MFWALIMVTAVTAAKLDNTYLPPPPAAQDAGGSDGALQVPLEPPYVDQYNPGTQGQQAYRPGTRSLTHGANDQFLQNDDEIIVESNPKKGKFISGSYSYTGPDNVLVTVTYKAADRKDRKIEDDSSSDDYDDESIVQTRTRLSDSSEDDEEEDGVIPTPKTLPSELARAFDFHKKKHDKLEGNTHKNKKPLRGGHHKYRGQQGHKDEEEHTVQHDDTKAPNTGYHYPPQPKPQYGAPTIHQGYSYPKQNS